MTYGEFMDLSRRENSNKVLSDAASTIAKSPKYDQHTRYINIQTVLI